MFLHPDLRALRENDFPQRAAQSTLERALAHWRSRTQVTALLRDISAFSAHCPIAECPVLQSLFEAGDAARSLASDFTAVALAGLRDAPLAHVPLRHFTDGLTSTLLLARAGTVTLALVATDGAALRTRPAPVTADFTPCEMWEHILAGTGYADLVARRTDAGPPVRRTIALRPGLIMCRDAGRDAMQLRAVDGCLISLRLQRRRARAGPACEYRLDDGSLVHQAAGTPQDSRIELAMALLGRMGRVDAVPLLEAIAREEGSDALRWQALRECLALDTSAGFQVLGAIAQSPGDALAAAAGTLRTQLIERYPQLAAIRCHA